MEPSKILLVCSLVLACPACMVADAPAPEPSACDDQETVAPTWMNWKVAVGEYGHHYRYTRSTVSFPADMVYCQYITTIEVDGEAFLGRELSVSGTAGMLCDQGWVETAEQVGSHTDDPWAAPAQTMETLYEDCCVMIMPSSDYYYADNGVGDYALFSYCGDTYCDDGGCSGGPLPDVKVDSIEFLE